MEKVMMLVVMLFVVMVAWETVTCAKGGREVLDFINQNRGGKGLPKGLQRKIDAWDYMVRYGYLTSEPEDMTWGEFQRDLKDAQKMMAIDQSGQVDDATAKMMAKDRCGNPDHVKDGDLTKRFVIIGAPYQKKTRHITWAVTQYSFRKTEAEVNWAIVQAYKGWANVTNLLFSPTTCGSPDTNFSFENFSSSTGTGTLGNSDWPQNHGLRMNTLFNWQLPPSTKAYQMVPTLMHEIGHQLGLRHSDVRSTVMWPWYSEGETAVAHSDDIAGIQSIYGGPDEIYNEGDTTDVPLPDSCVPEWFMRVIPKPGTK